MKARPQAMIAVPLPSELDQAPAGPQPEEAHMTGLEDLREAELQELRKECEELRTALRAAEAVRDDARAASQRYLDELRRIRPYVRHRRDCVQDDWNTTSDRCTCGLEDK